MAEYIEREALVRQIICNMTEFIGAPDDVKKHDEQCNYAISMIEDAPAADVEQVTRCKDCKFNSGVKKCLNPDSVLAVPADDDFCSYGERKKHE